MKALAFAALFALGVLLEPNQPKNDDNRFYVPAAIAYIHGDFTPNHEHPPVAKLIMGLGWAALHPFVDATTACRMPILALWAWTCLLLYGRVRENASQLAALGATATFVLMPRVLFDAHAETLDFTVAAFIFAAGLAFEKGERLEAVLFYALACGTKLNAPFAIAAALAFALTTRKRDWTLLVGVAIGSPLLALITWPWLWHDTWNRLGAYALFHLRHYPILYYFDGVRYNNPPAPWYAPTTMVLITTPIVALTLAAFGRNRFALLQIAFQLAAVSTPSTPKYAGVKLFIAIFPWLCLLVGEGLQRVLDELPSLRVQRLVVAAALAPALVSVIAYRGYWLSYYNELIGGVRNATAYETQYYDLAYPALRDALRNAHATKVAILPNPKEYKAHLAAWGFTPAPAGEADTVVITHERRWPDYWRQIAAFRGHRVATHRIHGVPLFSVYSPLPEAAQQR
jgi:4-amino-4-deoxy-L-arabinose transferase-like glycosyltransferase